MQPDHRFGFIVEQARRHIGSVDIDVKINDQPGGKRIGHNGYGSKLRGGCLFCEKFSGFVCVGEIRRGIDQRPHAQSFCQRGADRNQLLRIFQRDLRSFGDIKTIDIPVKGNGSASMMNDLIQEQVVEIPAN